MIHPDLPSLAADQPVDFVSVPMPPIPPAASPGFSFQPILEARARRRAVELYWRMLHQLLMEEGHPTSLERIDGGCEGGWRIYFRAEQPELVAALHEIAGQEAIPDNLRAFDAHDHVRDWLRRIEDRVTNALHG